MAKAQVGDLIRIVNADDSRYGNGDIFEVKEVYGDEGVYTVETDEETGEEGFLVFNEEFEIHRKAGEEDETDALAYYQSEVLGEEKVAVDAVNSPNHYTQGRFETIEVIEEITQGYSDGYVAYCVGNALKYLARAPFKHGEPTEDIAKAGAYIEFALERLKTQK